MNDGSLDRGKRQTLRRFTAAAGALLLAGCDRLSQTEWFPRMLAAGERLSASVSPVFAGRKAMAQEFSPKDLSPQFRSNGTFKPMSAQYDALAARNFADYVLVVDGLVERPQRLTLDAVRALPSRTQITRHDCVEGWSAIGKWKGARLSAILDAAGAKPQARYVVFHCADPMEA